MEFEDVDGLDLNDEETVTMLADEIAAAIEENYTLVLEDSGIRSLIDSHSVDYLRGYHDCIVEMSHHNVQDAINEGTEDQESAAILEALINEKVQKEEAKAMGDEWL